MKQIKQQRLSITTGIKSPNKSAGRPFGSYTAALMVDGVYKTGKGISLTKEDKGQIAYDTVSLWALDKAAELEMTTFVMPSKEALDKRILGLGKSVNLGNKALTVNLGESKYTAMFKGKGYARAALKNAIQDLGIDRVKGVMLDLVEHLDQFEIEYNDQAQKQEDANKTIAQSLFDVCKSTGIDMSASINNADVLMIYNQLKTQHKKDLENV